MVVSPAKHESASPLFLVSDPWMLERGVVKEHISTFSRNVSLSDPSPYFARFGVWTADNRAITLSSDS